MKVCSAQNATIIPIKIRKLISTNLASRWIRWSAVSSPVSNVRLLGSQGEISVGDIEEHQKKTFAGSSHEETALWDGRFVH